jgi:hypothetical protein
VAHHGSVHICHDRELQITVAHPRQPDPDVAANAREAWFRDYWAPTYWIAPPPLSFNCVAIIPKGGPT